MTTLVVAGLEGAVVVAVVVLLALALLHQILAVDLLTLLHAARQIVIENASLQPEKV